MIDAFPQNLSQLGGAVILAWIFWQIIKLYFEYQKSKDGVMTTLANNIAQNTKATEESAKATNESRKYLELRNGHLEEVLKEIKGKDII